MASTVTLGRTNTLTSAFLRYAPLTLSANDPALANGDWVRQFILSPPFAWWFNRGEVDTIVTQVGVGDYTVSVPNFGWIEKAVLRNPESGQDSWELEIVDNIVADANPNLPQRISLQSDDDAGNVTFRLNPVPDRAYSLDIVYQKGAVQFTALTDTWDPIPDRYSYIYNEGYLAKSAEYLSDPRFQESMQLFLQMVVGANQGLSDLQKNIYLMDRMNTLRQTQNVAQGRG